MQFSARDITYRIDDANRIVAVGEGWSEFANANAGAFLTPARVIGSSLVSWISDATTREVYAALLVRIRERSDAIAFRFRCDGPGVRRLLEMRMTGERDGQVEFRTTLVESQPRTAMSLMDATLIRSEAQVKICGWCMRLPDTSGNWLEIEEAVHALKLFEGIPIPQLSHTMCPGCYSSVTSALERPGPNPLRDVTLGELPHD